jgi:NADH dehydrogenase
MQANIRDEASVRKAVKGVDAVVNLVGILYESGKQKFSAVQAEGARTVAQAAAAEGVQKFVQLSAIGASSESEAAYAQSKAAGEAAVLEAIPQAVILRPSIVIGPEDDFFNRFAKMATLAPALPLVGGGETLYQPVAVQDVAQATCETLEDPNCGGKIYELGGPDIFSFKNLMENMLRHTGQKRILAPLPFFAAQLISRFTQFLPNPPLTPDQVIMLRSDNIADENLPGLGDLGIAPTPIESVLPHYLSRFKGR